MNKVILSIKKSIFLPCVCLVAIALWLAFCRSHYESYWYGTIYRVQTVDFNILHHTLPLTLSQLILSGQAEEVQKVLDSAYGIFGLVVTDPEGKEILFRTKAFYKKETWQNKISLEYLKEQNEPYDLLCDPPPLAVRYAHISPRIDQATLSKSASSGRVIGRVYYVRGVPPSFTEDLLGAMASNWFEMSGSKRGYILLTLIVVGFSMAFIYLVLWRKRVLQLREKELEAKESDLAIRRKSLDQLNLDIAAQRKRKEWLEQESELAYQRALRMKEALLNLKKSVFPNESPQEVSEDAYLNVRTPMHKASGLIAEIENLIPELTQNAKVLRSQAEVWQTYCEQLESRQAELQTKLINQSGTYPSPENPRGVGLSESSSKFS